MATDCVRSRSRSPSTSRCPQPGPQVADARARLFSLGRDWSANGTEVVFRTRWDVSTPSKLFQVLERQLQKHIENKNVIYANMFEAKIQRVKMAVEIEDKSKHIHVLQRDLDWYRESFQDKLNMNQFLSNELQHMERDRDSQAEQLVKMQEKLTKLEEAGHDLDYVRPESPYVHPESPAGDAGYWSGVDCGDD